MTGRAQVLVGLWLFSGSAVAADRWLSPPPDRVASKLVELQRDAFAEVPISAFSLAEAQLDRSSIVPLADYGAQTYKVEHLKCVAPNRLYLVRALYGNPSTGAFWLYRLDHELVVMHMYLGAGVTLRHSALVVCLDFKPTQIYVSVGGGM